MVERKEVAWPKMKFMYVITAKILKTEFLFNTRIKMFKCPKF